ncbi:MAG: ribonuclease HII [Clostridia bacterium]|nr:ribonuclease HII [Clostridia bacterium]
MSYTIKELREMPIENLAYTIKQMCESGEKVPPSIEKRLSEYIRVCNMRDFDRTFGTPFVAGVDEAGRGPLAGCVYTAAVILPEDAVIEGINDSKKLSEKKREELFDVIISTAVAYSITPISAEEIDKINIRNATYKSMNMSVNSLSVPAQFVLVDGDAITGMATPHQTVIKGDAKSQSISAASILAKVSRDRYMQELDKKYPEYGFAQNKGYGTAAHIEAIKKYGPCPEHRRSFIKNFV